MGKMTMNFGGKDLQVDDLVDRSTPKDRAKFQQKQQDMWNKSEKITPNTKPPKLTPLKGAGTNEGTDQASAERNLPNDYFNVMQDQQNKKGMQNYERDKKFKSGGKVSSASGRADGIAQKGKTKGKIIAMCGGGMYKK
jgi:hypothetical protein